MENIPKDTLSEKETNKDIISNKEEIDIQPISNKVLYKMLNNNNILTIILYNNNEINK